MTAPNGTILLIRERDPQLGCVVLAGTESGDGFHARFSCAFIDRIAAEPPDKRDHRVFWIDGSAEVVINTVEWHIRYRIGPHIDGRRWHDAERTRCQPQPTPLFDATVTPRVLAILGHRSAGDAWIDDLSPQGWTELTIDVDTSGFDAAIRHAEEQIRLAADPALNPIFGPAPDNGWQLLGYLKEPLEVKPQPLPEGILWPGA